MAKPRTPVKGAHLNYASSRWQMTRPSKVGNISDLLHKSNAQTLDEWMEFYNASDEGADPDERKAIARELFGHIRNEILSEIQAITEEDCLDFIEDLIGPKSFSAISDHEKQVRLWLKGQTRLEWKVANKKMESQGVDAFAQLRLGKVGTQMKPMSWSQGAGAHNRVAEMENANERFTLEHGGPVFVVVHDDRGAIQNPEIAEEIRAAISRLL